MLHLGWSPATFWAATPHEFMAGVGAIAKRDNVQPKPSRERLIALAEAQEYRSRTIKRASGRKRLRPAVAADPDK